MYDECIYSASNQAIRDQLNCSLGLFSLNTNYELAQNESRECEIQDVASNTSATVFYDILNECNQGKISNDIDSLYLSL